MTLEHALSIFQKTVRQLTGDYIEIDQNGYWSRHLKPGVTVDGHTQSKEAILVEEGSLLIEVGDSSRMLSKSSSVTISKGKDYKMTAGDEGASIKFKFQ